MFNNIVEIKNHWWLLKTENQFIWIIWSIPNLLFSSSASIISILATSEAYKRINKIQIKDRSCSISLKGKSNKKFCYLDISGQRSNLLELRVVPSQMIQVIDIQTNCFAPPRPPSKKNWKRGLVQNIPHCPVLYQRHQIEVNFSCSVLCHPRLNDWPKIWEV